MSDNDDHRLDRMEGRLRALEALILTLGLNGDQFHDAKEVLRSDATKTQAGDLRKRLVKDGPLDIEGEAALDSLRYRMSNHSGSET